MKKFIFLFLTIIIYPNPGWSVSEHVDLIKIDGGTINPITAEYISDAIDRAESEKAACLIILLDTPGGALTSTQQIVKKMLNANVPIAVYVYPSGSGAVSAGVSITIAANFAVMAPGTSIGAAHPVIGMPMGGQQDSSGIMLKKATNWWASFNKSIAEQRGRNVEWVIDAIKESDSITESEALEKNVINFICPDVDSLIILLDGKTTQVDSGQVLLHTKNAKLMTYEMNFRSRVLDIISNPSTAYILFMLGLLGIYFEFSNPGLILPGIVGALCIILFLFAGQILPINIAGILLIVLATILFILEIKIPSFGMLTIGGIISMFIGSLMLFKSTPSMQIVLPLGTIIAVTITTALFFIFAVGMALKAQRNKVTTGKEGIIEEIGIAVTNIKPEGEVKVHGEYWQAYSDQDIKKGEKIVVKEVNGLQLKVSKKE